MKFDREVCRQAESRLNHVLFEAEVRRLIRQEVAKLMAAGLTPPVKLESIANLTRNKPGTPPFSPLTGDAKLCPLDLAKAHPTNARIQPN